MPAVTVPTHRARIFVVVVIVVVIVTLEVGKRPASSKYGKKRTNPSFSQTFEKKEKTFPRCSTCFLPLPRPFLFSATFLQIRVSSSSVILVLLSKTPPNSLLLLGTGSEHVETMTDSVSFFFLLSFLFALRSSNSDADAGKLRERETDGVSGQFSCRRKNVKCNFAPASDVAGYNANAMGGKTSYLSLFMCM